MEARLRVKFIKISMLAVVLSLSVIFFSILLMNYRELTLRGERLLDVLIENGGNFPKPEQKMGQAPPKRDRIFTQDPFSTRFFTIRTDQHGQILQVDVDHVFGVSVQEASMYAKEVVFAQKKGDMFKHYKYRVSELENGFLLVFVDLERELDFFYRFVFSSALLMVSACLLIFLLIALLSKKAVSPIVRAYENQNRFLTDASHELKTPLSVIKTNAQLLSMKHVDSKWIGAITRQVDKMDALIEKMLTLMKLEENPFEKSSKTTVDLSSMVKRISDDFKSIAKNREMELNLQVEEEICVTGDEEHLAHMISLLLDNAIKYADVHSRIMISLSRGERVSLLIRNASAKMKKGDYRTLFERFKRLDSHRNSEVGGHGIGLSLVEAIVKEHGGTANAYCEKDGEFSIKIEL